MSASKIEAGRLDENLVLPSLLLAAAISLSVHANPEKTRKPADPPVAGASFYSDQERGWFWYEEPPVEEEKKPEEKPEPIQSQPAAENQEPEPEALPPTGSVAWLKICSTQKKRPSTSLRKPTSRRIFLPKAPHDG